MNPMDTIAGLNSGQKELLRRRLAAKALDSEGAAKHTRLVAFIKQKSSLPGDEVPNYREFLSSTLPAYMIPSIFKVVDSLPHNTNGKVDKRALREILDKEITGHSHASPIPETLSPEAQTLIRIWNRYLGRSDVSATDDFFQMGGDSLLAIQMISEANRNGIDIKVSEFFRTPVISALLKKPAAKEPVPEVANSMQIGESEYIHPLKPEGSLPPLFLIHEIASTVFMYRDLTRYLPVEQPVYAIQQKDLIFDDIGQMADRYCEEIRKVYPSGRFHLGGYCFGGHVAFEMARRLAEKGQSPPYVVMIDGILMNLVRYRPKYLWGFLKRQTPASIFERIVVKGKAFARRLNRAMRKGSGFKDEAADRYDISHMPDEMKAMMSANFRVQRDLRPKKYRGDMTLITTPSIYSELDPYTGWDRVVKGRISVHCIKSDHGNIMKEPSVRETAACIGRDLVRFFSDE